jgi:crotonobetainyl-CoA:carnitine CoA-transferase CaiB-like acyl-CoA transferase
MQQLPLAGVRVVEFVHMVMGPACGLVLADLGAEVIKVEPLDGDHTRKLVASGAGFFPTYNRNKKSTAVDLKSPEGREVVLKLIASADVVSENFRPGAMEKLGFGYEDLRKIKPDLIYCSHKVFLAGPYEHRTAHDEVVQMMGGLAYMTGGKGKPARAGASENDIMGGMFGAIAILAALFQRKTTGKGQEVKSALFENNVFLVAQHMMERAHHRHAGRADARPRARVGRLRHLHHVRRRAGLRRRRHRHAVEGVLRSVRPPGPAESPRAQDESAARGGTPAHHSDRRRDLQRMTKAGVMARCDELGLPFAPITRPEDLFDDPHLNASGGLSEITLPNGTKTKVPILPLEIDGRRLGRRLDLPRVGEHTRELLAGLGYDNKARIDALVGERVVVA